jgi:hypothetical protein
MIPKVFPSESLQVANQPIVGTGISGVRTCPPAAEGSGKYF